MVDDAADADDNGLVASDDVVEFIVLLNTTVGDGLVVSAEVIIDEFNEVVDAITIDADEIILLARLNVVLADVAEFNVETLLAVVASVLEFEEAVEVAETTAGEAAFVLERVCVGVEVVSDAVEFRPGSVEVVERGGGETLAEAESVVFELIVELLVEAVELDDDESEEVVFTSTPLS